jgi:thymidylate kinase
MNIFNRLLTIDMNKTISRISLESINAWENMRVKFFYALDAFKRDPRYRFIHINGEQSIEDVHKDIMTALQSQ